MINERKIIDEIVYSLMLYYSYPKAAEEYIGPSTAILSMLKDKGYVIDVSKLDVSYLGFKIVKTSNYVKAFSGAEYEFTHVDYDVDDNRHGYATTIGEAMSLIDDLTEAN